MSNWLGTWKHRKKINIDKSDIGKKLRHFPLAIPLGEMVGKNKITDLDYDFSGEDYSDINSPLWTLSNPYDKSYIKDSKWRFDSLAESYDTESRVTSAYFLLGDFDIQLDFDVTTIDAPTTSAQYAAVLTLMLPSGDFYVGRGRTSGTNGYALSGPSDTWDLHTSATLDSGKLRLVRKGAVLTGYYWTGAQWEWEGSTAGHVFSDDVQGPAQVQLWFKQEANENLVSDISNFVVNEGIPQWPEGAGNRDNTNDVFDELDTWNNQRTNVDDAFGGFDGKTLDTELWTISTGTPTVLNNRLDMSIAPGSGSTVPNFKSAFDIKGDFDIQADFDVPGLTHLWGCFTHFRVYGDSWNVNVTRGTNYTDEHISAGYNGSTTWSQQTDIDSGTFRIVRVGSNISFYFDIGNGMQRMATQAVNTSNVYILFYSSHYHAYPGIDAYISNFVVNSGEIVWPNTFLDTFTGDDASQPDEDAWYLSHDTSASGTFLINSNKLRSTIPDTANDEYMRIQSIFAVEGDFDIQVDFDEISADTPSADRSYPEYFGVRIDGDYIRVGMRIDSAGGVRLPFLNSLNISLTTGTAPYAYTSGKFRLTRVGTVIKAYSWSGSQWDWEGDTAGYTFADTATGHAFIEMTSQAEVNSGATVDWDNFTVVEGRVIWPYGTHPNAKKIAITMDDGVTQLFGMIENFDVWNKRGLVWASRNDWELDPDKDNFIYLYFDDEQEKNKYYIGKTNEEIDATTEITGDAFSGEDNDPVDGFLWSRGHNLWQTNTDERYMREAYLFDGKCRLNCPESTTTRSYSVLLSNFWLDGDFDIEFSGDVSNWGASTGVNKELSLYLWQTEANRAYVRFDSEDGYVSQTSLNDVWTTSSKVAASETYGAIRLVRTGANVRTYYKDGAGSFVEMDYTLFNDEPVFLQIFQAFDNEPFFVEVSDFKINSADKVSIYPGDNVWDWSYRGIWNHAQSGTKNSVAPDCCRRHSHGTYEGDMDDADVVQGPMGGLAHQLDGTNDCVSIPMHDYPEVGVVDKYSIASFFYLPDWTTTPGDSKPMSCTQSGGFSIDFDPSPDDLDSSHYIASSYRTPTSIAHTYFSPGYHFVYATYDEAKVKFYVDGKFFSHINVTGDLSYTLTTPLLLGAEPGTTGPTGGYFPGRLFYSELSWQARSSEWIKTFYNNLTDNLLSFEPKEVPFLTGFNYRRKVIVDHTKLGQDLTQFPLAIVMNDSAGKDSQDVADIFSVMAPGDITGDDFSTFNSDYWTTPVTDAADGFSWDAINERISYKRNEVNLGDTVTFYSKFAIEGDFDIQIDFGGADTIAVDGRAAYLSIAGNTIMRYRSGAQNGYWYSVDGDSGWGTWPDDTGKLRIRRYGNWVKVYRWDGAAWDERRSLVTTNFAPSRITFQWRATSNEDADYWLDNFEINQGTIVWPDAYHPNMKKIAITKDDGLTKLYGEIERFDEVHQEIVIWVAKDDLTLSSKKDTELYIYFDPAADKDVNYIGFQGNPQTVTNITGDAFALEDDAEPDKALWYPTWGQTHIESEKLVVATDGGHNGIRSLFTLSGDFDIRIDWEMDAIPATTSWAMTLRTAAVDSALDNFFTVSRRYDGTQIYKSYKTDDGVDGTNTDESSSDTSGVLRITRVNNVFTGYFWNGSGWTTLGVDTISGMDGYEVAIQLYLTCWTSNPSVSGKFDSLVIFSGTVKYNPGFQVWDNDFVLVNHMAQVPGTSILDSSKMRNHGTTSGISSSERVKGSIGWGFDFDADNAQLIVPAADSINDLPSGAMTLEVCANPNTVGEGGYGRFAEKRNAPNANGGWRFYTRTTEAIYFDTRDSGGTQDAAITSENYSVAIGEHNVVGLTFSENGDNTPVLHREGNEIQNQSPTIGAGASGTDAAGDLYIGSREADDRTFDGIITEFRISTILRSKNWMKATGHTLKDTLVSFGELETDTDWLGTWKYRRKISIDFSNIDETLKHFPVPLVLGDDVGMAPLEVNYLGDTFEGTDGDLPNSNMWTLSLNDIDTITILNNRLYFDCSTVAGDTVAWAKYKLSGDFDVQVDFEDLIIGVDTVIGIRIDIAGDTWYGLHNCWRSASPHEYRLRNGGGGNSTKVTTTDKWGRLRLVREGANLKGYYWGDAQWELIDTFTSVGTGLTTIGLLCYSNNKLAEAYFKDWKVNSGTPVWDDGEGKWSVSDVFDAISYRHYGYLDSPNASFSGTNGDPLDSKLWRSSTNAAGGTALIHTNKARMTVPDGADDEYVIMYCNVHLSGDFEFEVEYERISSDAPSSSQSYVPLLTMRTEDGYAVYLGQYHHTTNGLRMYRDTNDTGSTSYNEPFDVGKLKIRRIGTTYNLAYWDGDSWVWGTHVGGFDYVKADTSNVRFELKVQADFDSGAVCDIVSTRVNFGTPVWPIVYEDDFTGTDTDPPNTGLWELVNADGTDGLIEVNTDNIRHTITSAVKLMYQQSSYYLSGDFDIRVDWERVSDIEQNIWLGGIKLQSDTNFGFIVDIRYSSFVKYNSTAYIPAAQTASAVATSDTTGAFRIVRAGTTITSYYWDSVGEAYVQLYTYTGATVAEPVRVWLRTYTTTSMSFTFDFTKYRVINGLGDMEMAHNQHPNQKKIAITKEDGVSQLYGEVDTFDDFNKKIVLWVSKANWDLKAGNLTDLYLYYDRDQDDNDTYIGTASESAAPQTVWNKGFYSVWNLSQQLYGNDLTGEIPNSTDLAVKLTPRGGQGPGAIELAPIGKAQILDGTDDGFIQSGSISMLTWLTATVMFKSGDNTQKGAILGHLGDARWTNYGKGIQYDSGGKITIIGEYGNNNPPIVATAGAPNEDEWYVVDAVFGNNGELFIDTVSKGTGKIDDGTAYTFALGSSTRSSENAANLEGSIALVQLSRVVRSDAWLKANFHGIKDNLITFKTTSLEEYVAPPVMDETALEDMRLDIQTYQDVVENLGADMLVGGNIVSDIKMDLSAFYESIADLKTDFSLLGNIFDDMSWDAHVGKDAYDHLKMELSAYFQSLTETKLDLKTFQSIIETLPFDFHLAVEIREDGKLDFSAGLESFDDLKAAFILTQSIIDSDCPFDIAIGDGIIYKDNKMHLDVSDGNKKENLGLHLTIVAPTPVFKAIYGIHLESAIKDVT